MRISTSYQFDTYSRDIARSQELFFESQRQVSTGKRIHKPSDDPFGANIILSTNTLKDAATQYAKNLQTGKTFLSYTESALGEASTLTRRAYELAVKGANGATDQTAREGMVSELDQLKGRLMDVANSQGQNGQYIFAGQNYQTKPFTVVAGAIVYNGDTQDVSIESGPSEVMSVSVAGDPLFTEVFDAIDNLRSNLLSGNTGALSGVDIPALQSSLNSLNGTRGEVGARLQRVEQSLIGYQRRIDEFTETISDTEEIDMAQAIVSYQSAQTAYQAALNVASQGFRLSLMDFLRG